jgi:general nucleoside transport system ATP-binding protein
MAITDYVSVMRQGLMVDTLKTSETSPEQLAELMVGRRVLLRVEKGPANPGGVLLSVENLVVKDDLGVTRVKGVSFDVRAGEIVGIAGVAGNGQSELLEAVSGMRDQSSGVVRLKGTPLSLEGDDGARRARKAGLAHVPEDRQRMGLVVAFEEWENAILGYENNAAYGRGMLLDIPAAHEAARQRIKEFDIRPSNERLKTANFSGGNQQKIVLAREMSSNPDVLIVGQPTRGVDIGAIEFIHNQIIKMRDAGKAILLVSVELDEIRSLSDRILVMFDGQVVGEADPATATEGELGMMMAGAHEGQAVQARVAAGGATP